MSDWLIELEKKRLANLAKLQAKYDVTKMKLIDHNKYRDVYFISNDIQDDVVTEKTLVVRFEAGSEFSRHIATTRKQRFLCVNGPKEGDRFTLGDGEAAGYRLYNNSSRPRRQDGGQTPSAVLVWFED